MKVAWCMASLGCIAAAPLVEAIILHTQQASSPQVQHNLSSGLLCSARCPS